MFSYFTGLQKTLSISNFFPHSGAGKRKLQLEETGTQSSTKATQRTQQQSLQSVCSVNFKCGNTSSIKQGLTPLVTSRTHMQAEPTVRACRLQSPSQPLQPPSGHTGERFTTTEPLTDNPTHSIRATCTHACQFPSH